MKTLFTRSIPPVLLIALITSGFALISSTAATASVTTHRLSAYGVSFGLPSKWTMDKSTVAPLQVHAQDLGSPYGSTGVELLISKQPGVTEKQFTAGQATAISKETLCSQRKVTSKSVIVAGVPALRVDMSCVFNYSVSLSEVLHYYFFVRSGFGYELIYQSSAANDRSSGSPLNAIISSIRLFKPSAD